MTSNAGSKRRRRDRARDADVAYSQALPGGATGTADRDQDVDGLREDGYRPGLSRKDLERHLDQAEAAYGQDGDPWRKQAGYTTAASLYEELAWQVDDPTVRHAVKLAALMLRTFGARVRWANGIPTIHPQSEAHLLGLGACAHCGRSWINSVEPECGHCPRLRFGPTPHDAQDAKQFRGGGEVRVRHQQRHVQHRAVPLVVPGHQITRVPARVPTERRTVPAHDYGTKNRDRTYHGIQEGPETTGRAHDLGTLLVRRTPHGVEERRRRPLRELPELSSAAFTWGYDGNGPSATAAAILADALNLDPALLDGGGAPEPYATLREDFVEDFLVAACDEFRLRRRAVLQWVHGWWVQHGAGLPLPLALADLHADLTS